MKPAGVGLIFACAAGLSGCVAYISCTMLPHEGIRPETYGVRIERDVTLLTEDKVALVADIYRPETPERTPTILIRIPYAKTLRNSLAQDAVAEFWARRGYTVVVQGTRGRYKSGGKFYPLRHERADGLATLAWLGKQPWFDGRLGTWGGSAFGHTQWAIADQSSPGPSALAIQIVSTDFHQMYHPGGAFSFESALFWAIQSYENKDEPPAQAKLDKGFNGFPLIQADDRAAADVSFFNDWATNTERNDYWRQIDGDDRPASLSAPVLLLAGWYDPFLPGQLRDFQAIRGRARSNVATESRLIVGPWTHANSVTLPDGTGAAPYRPASLAPTIPWFDHYLLGKPLDPSLAAPVRIYVMGEDRWRDEAEWPPARAIKTSFYLRSSGRANSAAGDGLLANEAPAAGERADEYDYDPLSPVPSKGGAMLGPRAGMFDQREVEQRRDVLVYSTAPLDRDVEVTGEVRAHLYVQTSAPSTDFTVKLVDVHPDGRAFNASDGILRRAYPPRMEGPEEIVVELWPISRLFRKGHRLRVEVSSSNFPRYDRNPNTGGDIVTETRTQIARQRIFHEPERASRIVLPVIPLGGG